MKAPLKSNDGKTIDNCAKVVTSLSVSLGLTLAGELLYFALAKAFRFPSRSRIQGFLVIMNASHAPRKIAQGHTIFCGSGTLLFTLIWRTKPRRQIPRRGATQISVSNTQEVSVAPNIRVVSCKCNIQICKWSKCALEPPGEGRGAKMQICKYCQDMAGVSPGSSFFST